MKALEQKTRRGLLSTKGGEDMKGRRRSGDSYVFRSGDRWCFREEKVISAPNMQFVNLFVG